MITKKKFNRILKDLEYLDSAINFKISRYLMKIGLYDIWYESVESATHILKLMNRDDIDNYDLFCKIRIKQLKILMKEYII